VITLRGLTSGVLIGWVSTFLSIAVGLFMSPFLIHHLGETGYGVWVLVQSTVSYMYFMDLGLRTTVVRFTAEAQAREDHEEVSNVVSAALWIRLWTACGVMAIACVLAAILPHVFKLPAQYAVTARVALLMAATTLSSTLVFSVFTAVLSGLGRFDLLGMLELGQVSLTSLGLVPIILTGHGLIAMASWQLTVVLGINLLTTAVCFRTYPHLRCHFRKPERKILRSLWNLGLWVLICNGAGQLILYTDNVVVGAFVAAAAVSYYAVAGKMVEYVRQIAFSVLKYFMPLASSFRARNQFDRLRQLHLRGTQVVLLVTYPIVITLFVRGSTLLRLWIGATFSAEASRILQVLSVAAAIMLANASVNGVALALDRQRLLALVTGFEGVCNLVISVILVRRIGVLGVALGTLIPTVLTSFLFWPGYLCRLLGMSTVHYLRDAWLRPMLALVPFVLVSRWADAHWIPPRLVWFVLQSACLLPVAALGALLVFWKDIPAAKRLLLKRRAETAPSELSA
jgi:O-antigen/teichoic acid export membrane protein